MPLPGLHRHPQARVLNIDTYIIKLKLNKCIPKLGVVAHILNPCTPAAEENVPASYIASSRTAGAIETLPSPPKKVQFTVDIDDVRNIYNALIL